MSLQVTTFYLENLCCGDDEMLIRKNIGRIKGVHNIKCNIVTRRLTIEHSCSKDEFVRVLKNLGFTPRLHFALDEPTTFWQRYGLLLSNISSGVFLVTGIILSHFALSEIVLIPVFLASIFTGGWQIAIRGFKAAKYRTMDMNFLMTIAVLGAMGIGKWEEGAAVVFFFSLSLLLERFSMERARKAIRSLMSLSPTMAMVKRGSFSTLIPVEEIDIGERILIRPGEQIPLDGKVVSGDSMVNQAPITGESHPIRKQVDNVVFAGSFNERGTLDVEVTRKFNDTTLAHIIQRVEQAQADRAPVQNFTDRFARYYTPTVISIAALLAIVPPIVFHEPFGIWFYRSLVLLVIACPCALVISTPVSIVSGLSNAARRGVLIKGGRTLEEIGRVSAIAFDKTGTLTVGSPRVTDVIPIDSLSPHQIIQLSANVEANSEHHLAGAILKKAYEDHLPIDNVTNQHFEAITGYGVTATIDEVTYSVGSHTFIEQKGICTPTLERVLQRLEAEGKTTIILTTEDKPLGVIALADEVRLESASTVKTLFQQGVKHIVMLTGDNHGTAYSIARQSGIDKFHADILPEEKVRIVKQLRDQYGGVAMVGDGINDAPALASSTVGIAMGTSGTDIALETADIVLMSDDLTKLPYIMALSKKTLSIIKQNIVISLATKLIFLFLGVQGIATLWMAVLADDGAALIVILNGLRILGLKGTSIEDR